MFEPMQETNTKFCAPPTRDYGDGTMKRIIDNHIPIGRSCQRTQDNEEDDPLHSRMREMRMYMSRVWNETRKRQNRQG